MNLQQLLPTGFAVRAEFTFLSDRWNGFLVEAGFDLEQRRLDPVGGGFYWNDGGFEIKRVAKLWE